MFYLLRDPLLFKVQKYNINVYCWETDKIMKEAWESYKRETLTKNLVERQGVSNTRIENNFNNKEIMNSTLWSLCIVGKHLKVNNVTFGLSFNKL